MKEPGILWVLVAQEKGRQKWGLRDGQEDRQAVLIPKMTLSFHLSEIYEPARQRSHVLWVKESPFYSRAKEKSN